MAVKHFLLNQLLGTSCHGPSVKEVLSQLRCLQKRDEGCVVCKRAVTLF